MMPLGPVGMIGTNFGTDQVGELLKKTVVGEVTVMGSEYGRLNGT